MSRSSTRPGRLLEEASNRDEAALPGNGGQVRGARARSAGRRWLCKEVDNRLGEVGNIARFNASRQRFDWQPVSHNRCHDDGQAGRNRLEYFVLDASSDLERRD